MSSEEESEPRAQRPVPDARAEPPAPEGAETPGDRAPRRTRAALELAGLVIAATTLISALAFYFGWAITSSKVAYFGIDSSAVGFGTQEYILRSTDALFVPLGTLVVLALMGLMLHSIVTRAIVDAKRRPLLRRISRGGVVVGGVVLAIGLYGAIESLPRWLGDYFMAAAPAIGIAGLAYCLHVIALIDTASSSDARQAPQALPRHAMTLVCTLIGLSAFWTIAVFATQQGHDRGRALGADLSKRPAVTVFSPKALHLADAGANEHRLAGADSAYRYRYSGLRLIFHANGKYFLVADDWCPSTGTAIVLTDDPSLRFEFRPGSA